jgi:hypothetical protein
VGNLIQLGDQHATVAAKWAKSGYGPVFQVRMGNKVRPLSSEQPPVSASEMLRLAARCLRQHIRFRPPTVD